MDDDKHGHEHHEMSHEDHGAADRSASAEAQPHEQGHVHPKDEARPPEHDAGAHAGHEGLDPPKT